MNRVLYFYIICTSLIFTQGYFTDCTGSPSDCVDDRINCVGEYFEFTTIQNAINAFESEECVSEFDCVVLIDDGIYNENLQINKNITIASRFICDENITHRDSTIIDGINIDDPNSISSGILIIPEDGIGSINPSIIGLTITNGLGTELNFFDAPNYDDDILLVGGGVTMVNSFPIIRFNKFLSNGFVYNDEGGTVRAFGKSSSGGALAGFLGSGIGVGREILPDREIITIEENIYNGGIGSLIANLILDNNLNLNLKRIALKNEQCFKYGSIDWLHKHYSIDQKSLTKIVYSFAKLNL